MTDVDALVAFIRARLDEEERDAKAAAAYWPPPGVESALSGNLVREVASALTPRHAAHIDRQDPAATLARVAALRALVDLAEARLNHPDLDSASDTQRAYALGARTEARRSLLCVASSWPSHEDYQQEWTP